MRKFFAIIVIIVIFIGSFWLYLLQNQTVPILMYHSFNPLKVGKYVAVNPQTFYQQMKFIKENKKRVISLRKYCQLLKDNKPLPKNSVIITIDDGYKDNLIALEILKKFNYPATIFFIVNKINKEEYLSYEDIRSFLKNTRIEIGSHTLSHAYLPDLSEEETKKEIYGSKKRLQEVFSQDITTISYPIGGFDEETLEEVEKAGYLCACTTNRGISRQLNRFALRRIKVTNRDRGIRMWAKLSGFYNIFKRPKSPY